MLRDQIETAAVVEQLRAEGYSHAWVLTTTDRTEDLFMVPVEEAAGREATADRLKALLPDRKVWVLPFQSGYKTSQLY